MGGTQPQPRPHLGQTSACPEPLLFPVLTKPPFPTQCVVSTNAGTKLHDILRRVPAEGLGCIHQSKLSSHSDFCNHVPPGPFSALLVCLEVTLAEGATGHSTACKLWSDPQDSPCLSFSKPQFPLTASVGGQLGTRDRVLQKAWLTADAQYM